MNDMLCALLCLTKIGRRVLCCKRGGTVQVPRAEGLQGLPVALEEKQEEGQSKQEREAALEEAVEQRMNALLSTLS